MVVLWSIKIFFILVLKRLNTHRLLLLYFQCLINFAIFIFSLSLFLKEWPNCDSHWLISFLDWKRLEANAKCLFFLLRSSYSIIQLLYFVINHFAFILRWLPFNGGNWMAITFEIHLWSIAILSFWLVLLDTALFYINLLVFYLTESEILHMNWSIDWKLFIEVLCGVTFLKGINLGSITDRLRYFDHRL